MYCCPFYLFETPDGSEVGRVGLQVERGAILEVQVCVKANWHWRTCARFDIKSRQWVDVGGLDHALARVGIDRALVARLVSYDPATGTVTVQTDERGRKTFPATRRSWDTPLRAH